MDLGLSCSTLSLQPPAHLGSLPADVLLLIMRHAAFPLSLWVAIGEAEAERRSAQKRGGTSSSFRPPAMVAPAAAPAAPPPAAQSAAMPAGVAVAVAEWNAALSRAHTPEQLAQGLAGLSFSSHVGPFVFGAGG